MGGGGSNRVRIIVGLIVLVFIAIFAAIIFIDSRQRAANSPPEGVQDYEVTSRDHTKEAVTYDQNPPVGGAHDPVWQNAGFYDQPVRNENAVHTMEHGAVWITYSPDLSQDQKDELRDTTESQDCILTSPYPDLPEDTPVVASAWGKQLQLTSADDPNLQKFIHAYRRGPQTPEPGAACTGGTGQPASS